MNSKLIFKCYEATCKHELTILSTFPIDKVTAMVSTLKSYGWYGKSVAGKSIRSYCPDHFPLKAYYVSNGSQKAYTWDYLHAPSAELARSEFCRLHKEIDYFQASAMRSPEFDFIYFPFETKCKCENCKKWRKSPKYIMKED